MEYVKCVALHVTSRKGYYTCTIAWCNSGYHFVLDMPTRCNMFFASNRPFQHEIEERLVKDYWQKGCCDANACQKQHDAQN